MFKRRISAYPCAVIGLGIALTAGSAIAQAPAEPEAAEPEAAEPEAAEPEAAEPETAEPETAESELTPPRLVRSQPPSYPEGRIEERRHPSVGVQVVLDERGQVIEASVEHTAGEDFDREAIAAVRRWHFEPARRGDRAIPSRVQVAVHFDLPAFELETRPLARAEVEPPTEESADERPTDPATGSPEGELGIETEVRGREVRAEDRSAGDFRLTRDVLELAPVREGIEVLNRAPGVYVARMGGDAVAPRIFLRGFDAEHGQDIELRVGGLRINQASHIHGQGYADLGFLIGEVVDQMRVREGVYDPRQGDFAVAGSIDLQLGVRERGWRLSASYGSFNTARALAVWAPRGAPRETFGAVQYRQTDGFGANRAGQSGSAMAQVVLDLGEGWRMRTVGIGYAARAQTAGLLRAADVDTERVDLHGVYPFATARAQVASTTRVLVGLWAEYAGEDGESGEMGLFGGYDSFRFLPNFTGFLESPTRGDLIEQTNQTASLGMHARYRTRDERPWAWARAALELGLQTRLDVIEQQQTSSDAARMNRAWAAHIDASIIATDIGLYADADLGLSEYVNLRLGVRGDVLHFEIDDRLIEESPPSVDLLPGLRRTAMGFAFGPRASIEVRPIDEVSLRAAYGEGFRSPQARTLTEGAAPYTKVRSADVGARFSWEQRLTVTVAGYLTYVDSDVAFEPHEGTLEIIGPSRRVGFVAHVETRPFEWLRGAVSVTYVNAELLETPGESLPYVPPLVLRADVGARHTLDQRVFGQRLTGRIGLGFSYLSPRPQPFGPHAADVALLDASAGLRLGPLEIGVEVFNLTDARYAAIVQTFESNWSPGTTATGTAVQHVAAGSPLTVLATMTLSM